MIDVLLAADVRRQDAEASSRGITVETLMHNAGFAVARSARELLEGTYGRRIVVVCGKGNNAGDGLVAGRILRAWGAHVTAVLLFEQLSGPPAAQRHRFGGSVVGIESLEREVARADLVVDAIFGVGLTRAPDGDALRAIQAINRADAPVLAVDVPSGVDADTGRLLEDAIEAEATISLGGLKPGLLCMPGAAHAGALTIADIGMPEDLRAGVARALEGDDVASLLPVRSIGTNKRRAGTVLIVAGSRAMPGAAALVAGACVHAGAGLTTLLAPEDVCRVVLGRVPEMTTIPTPESSEGAIDPKAIDLLRPRLREFHAIAIGPGLSTHPAAVETVRAILAETEVPVVLDADGLGAFEGAGELLAQHRGGLIITPHAGELSRLLERPAAQLEDDRLGAAIAAAGRFGAVTVFKGAGTVVASPDGEVFVNPTGSESLAQGGTGDVLTGVLGALVAQGNAAGGWDAALVAAGVWLHGRAADRIAARIAPHPANASALIEELGPAFHEVMSG